MNSLLKRDRPGVWRSVLAVALAAGLLGLGGCTQIARVLGNRPPKVTVSRAPLPAETKPKAAEDVDNTPAPPLQTIISRQLQTGHYAKGREQLKRYIHQHPGDRAARDMWRQLTVDPEKMLGSRSRIHVVKPGDTYSSMAARYLGDASRFLVLARYNDATDPSRLRVGQRIRVPVAPHLRTGAPEQAKAEPRKAPPEGAADAVVLDKAQLLQQQSLALESQGRHTQAMHRMEQALDADPKLKSSGSAADALRKQVLASWHQRAIILYRDQKLSPAIALWDKILAIDPGYEPAIIYRSRARELQSRLKQL